MRRPTRRPRRGSPGAREVGSRVWLESCSESCELSFRPPQLNGVTAHRPVLPDIRATGVRHITVSNNAKRADVTRQRMEGGSCIQYHSGSDTLHEVSLFERACCRT